MQTVESKEHTDMITQENQLNGLFQDKNLGRIWPNYPQGKTNPLKENWNFYKRFNPKSIATSSSNLLTRPCASFKSTDSSFSWIYTNKSTLACDFEIPLKGFRSPLVMILMQQLCSTNAWL